MVSFRTQAGPWVVPVEQALEVRTAGAMRPLPMPMDDVVGVVERDGDAIPVLSALDASGQHVLLLCAGGETVGVLVSEVMGVVSVARDSMGPAPAGQNDPLVCATVQGDHELMFQVDVDALARAVGISRRS